VCHGIFLLYSLQTNLILVSRFIVSANAPCNRPARVLMEPLEKNEPKTYPQRSGRAWASAAPKPCPNGPIFGELVDLFVSFP
jgi:hypothetical protein